jgi:tetratricopeptide (TPR) repeat protein
MGRVAPDTWSQWRWTLLCSRTLLMLPLAIALAAPALAQDWKGMGRMEGRVTDEQGAVLPGVNVKLEVPERGGTTIKTDKKGRWAIAGIVSGSWNIDFAADGYEAKSIKVNLPTEASRLPPIEVTLAKAAPAGPGPEVEQALAAADAAYKGQRFPEARAEYEKLLRLRPELGPRIHQQIGFCYIQEKRFAQALEQLQMVLEAEPGNTQVRAIAAQAALEGGLIDRGRELLAGLDASSLKDPDVLFNIGVNFLNARQTEDAIRYFTRTVELDPKYVDGYFRRALGYLQVGKTAESRADFQKVLELAPTGEQADMARKALEQTR